MTRTHKTIETEAKEDRSGSNFHSVMWQANTGQKHRCDNDRNRQRMAEHHRWQRPENSCALMFLQPQRHREEPSHGRIDPVKNTQPKDRQPRPEVAHGKQKESLEES